MTCTRFAIAGAGLPSYTLGMSRAPLTDEQKRLKRERERLWRANNKERIAAKNARYRAANPTVFTDYYAKHRTKRIADAVAYQRAHQSATRAKTQASYWKRKAEGKPVRGNDKDQIRARNADRRALKKSAGSRLPRETIPRLLEQQRGFCAGCSCNIRLRFHVDHIMPLARGGRHDPSNLQLLCPPCNLQKHAKDPLAWRQSKGFLI